jgi:hypothetical protein
VPPVLFEVTEIELFVAWEADTPDQLPVLAGVLNPAAEVGALLLTDPPVIGTFPP